jgi:beta-fructofuranosidase
VPIFSTLNTPTSQTQEIAYSYDGGYTFTKYANNPVLSIGSSQFRDPKVTWYKDHWVMVVALSTEFAISIYTSPNLINWSFASNFSHYGLLGLQYECPGLTELPIRGTDDKAWVMYISINPGAPLGGSIGEYFVGDFDGYKFTPYDNAVRIPDFAKDNYATQWFFGTNPDEEPVSIAWASNWQYTNNVPTGAEGWRSIMSLPRRNYLDKATRIGWVLGSAPYDLAPITSGSLLQRGNLLNDSVTVDYASLSSGALYFRVNMSYPESPVYSSIPATFTFNFSSSASGESIKGGYYFSGDNAGALWLDRGGTNGFDNPFFTDKFSLTQAGPPLAQVIEGVIDRSVLEVFLDKGHFSGTSVFFPKSKLDRMVIKTEGMAVGMKVEVGVWGLKGTW